MKQFILILFILTNFSISAQRLETKRVIEVSDSILLSRIDKELFNHFEISVGSFYKYQNNNKRETTGKFLTKKYISQKTTEIWVLYHFHYHVINGINGGTWIKLSKNLKLIDTIELGYIPDFLWKKEPCNFISIQQALRIGIENFIKSGIKIEEPILEYNDKYKLYTYLVANVLTKTKNQIGQDAGQTEVVVLNAITGELLDRYDGSYGIIIR